MNLNLWAAATIAGVETFFVAVCPMKPPTGSLAAGQGYDMNDEELLYPEWQIPLQELVLEFDREKLAEKIRKVDSLIVQRLLQLVEAGDGREERAALNDGINILRVIKRERLGNPGN
jgi:hypothetical protein